MRLKRAHESAFQEYLRDHGTNRLYAKAAELAKQHPLPEPKQTQKIKRGIFKRWKENEYVTAVPQSWTLCSVGRKGRRLVVILALNWKYGNGKPSWEYHTPTLNDDGEHYPTFLSDEVIFPLTPQQAMWVGAKNLTSRNEYAVCWGTQQDVEQLHREFPFPVALPSL